MKHFFKKRLNFYYFYIQNFYVLQNEKFCIFPILNFNILQTNKCNHLFKKNLSLRKDFSNACVFNEKC